MRIEEYKRNPAKSHILQSSWQESRDVKPQELANVAKQILIDEEKVKTRQNPLVDH